MMKNQKSLKYLMLSLVSLLIIKGALGQNNLDNQMLKLRSEYSSNNIEIRDILDFEGIEYLKLHFSGADLPKRSYHLKVKEYWDGVLVKDSTIMNSADVYYESLRHVNDTTLTIKVLAKHSDDDQLTMQFKFPRFSITRQFDALNSDDYSLRNLVEESRMEIDYENPFYLLAYILPYERPDGSKSWCDVGTSGSDIDNWGKEFGIKHYLLFEMVIE